jgi:hypothetical protein
MKPPLIYADETYLKATGMKLGLLINFGANEGVVIERFAN